MQVLTIDFETYYSKEYSLGRMSTWDYITDERFQVIGVSVKQDAEPAVAFSGTHMETLRFLQQFDWASSAALGHHAAFDLAILKWKFGLSPKLRLDTWSMCNALHGSGGSVSLARMVERYLPGKAKGTDREAAIGFRREDFTHEHLTSYMKYCCDDSDLTYELFLAVLSAKFPLKELRVIDWTMRCYTEPSLRLDAELLETELASVRLRKETALKAAGVTNIADLRKDDYLAALLTSLGVDPPRKTTAKGNDKYAFAKSDVSFLELREHEDDRVAFVVEARLEAQSSIEETRIMSLLKISRQCHALPFPLTYFGASTGRWSAWDDINMQNLPKKGRIRECVIAPPGKVIIAADLSQIELRILSWAAGEQKTLDILGTGGDVYSHTAIRIYKRPINKKDNPVERFMGKSSELGCGFGCGWPKFMSMVLADAKRYGIQLDDVSPSFFEGVVSAYRESHPNVVSMWEEARRAISNMIRGGVGFIAKFEYRGNRTYLPRGIPMVYNNVSNDFDPATGKTEVRYDRYNANKRKTTRARLWFGTLVENLVQATARDVFVNCLILAEDMGYKAVGSVHDELLFLVDEADVDKALVDIKKAMTTAPDWLPNCPLDCEINYGANYAEAK